MDSIDLKQQFPQEKDILYLNHAAVSPWPQCSADAVAAFARQNVLRGATDYPNWLAMETNLRKRLAYLIGAPSPGNIALQKNTSEGLSVIAYGLQWNPGDRIVISDQEFPSNRIVWESLQTRGVLVHEVSLDGEDPEAALIQALESRPRILSISSVQYGTGLTLDLERIGEACQRHGVLFCIDAIQSLGAIPFDVERYQADFVVADGHKWMMGPEGLALMYLSDRVLNELELHQFGWHMVKNRGDYDTRQWTPATDATRYECGSPNMLGAVALNASVGLLLKLGLENIQEMIMTRISHLQEQIASRPELKIITNTLRPQRSGILTFSHGKLDARHLHPQLMKQGVICAYRGGGVRFSPHFYTPLETLSNAVDLIPRT